MILKTKKSNKFIKYFELAFKIEFLIYGLLSFNSFTYCRSIMSYFVIISVAMAGILLVYRLINYKNYIKNKFLWILIVFLFSYLISLIFNIKYGYMSGLKTFVWMGIQYILLFATDLNKKELEYKKDFDVLSVIFVIYMFVASIISIVMLLLQYNTITLIDCGDKFVKIINGFLWGRLWGVFTDPNYGSVMSVVAIILSIYIFIDLIKNKFLKVLIFLNIILQILYISFSDSRTGIVSLIVALVFLTIAYYNKSSICSDRRVLRVIVGILFVFVAILVGYILPKIVTNTYNNFIEKSYVSTQDERQDERQDKQEDERDKKKKYSNKSKIGREADIENDISNRRFDLWKSGYEIFKTKPIYGVSFENIISYVQKNLPETYLVNNNHGVFGNFHNAYVNILVGQGIIGLFISLIFTIMALFMTFRYYFSKDIADNTYKYFTFYIAIILSIGSSMMFLSETFYVNSANATMFWVSSGMIVHSIYRYKNINEITDVGEIDD